MYSCCISACRGVVAGTVANLAKNYYHFSWWESVAFLIVVVVAYIPYRQDASK